MSVEANVLLTCNDSRVNLDNIFYILNTECDLTILS